MAKRYLFLQGPMGPFFSELGSALEREGHDVLRINFNGGDCFFWRGENTLDFTGRIEEWPEFICNLSLFRKITDLVVYGDCRPVHRLAIEQLKPLGITVHAFEEGYLRPSYVTLEQGGINAHSPMPRTPEFYEKLLVPQSEKNESAGKAVVPMSLYAALYYFLSLPGGIRRFRHYEHHFQRCPHRYIFRWIPRYLTLTLRRIDARIKRLRLRHKPFYLVPLQLNRDAQVMHHSGFPSVEEFATRVIESFASHAPADAFLVVKNHPLENGMDRLRQKISAAAEYSGVEKRVIYVDGGKLPWLLRHCLGVITINSTAGLSALHHGKPTLALGKSVYNMPGLTAQKALDDFWTQLEAPDHELFMKFRGYLLQTNQHNGSFYTRMGREMLLETVVPVLAGRAKTVAEVALTSPQ